eukprot:CAMPEP_0170168484 /NCGR_PEP_ID=MMETSP0040_2-20121228/1507_1 /TAXON_ID=641309 /ORGANISM="Lotharella oceanica, Strain CCMP622" /LENGTH=225 /DNA_ID=CAMNT_0010406745 /DNA_START=14 /DNA_END=691 /DNA_ORIENTATION=-
MGDQKHGARPETSFSSTDNGEDDGWSHASPLYFAGLTGLAPIINQARANDRYGLQFVDFNDRKRMRIEPAKIEPISVVSSPVTGGSRSFLKGVKLKVEPVRNLKVVPTKKRKSKTRKPKRRGSGKSMNDSLATVRGSSTQRLRRGSAPARLSSRGNLKIVPLRKLNIVSGRPEGIRRHSFKPGGRRSSRGTKRDIGVRPIASHPSSRAMYAYIFGSDVDSEGGGF